MQISPFFSIACFYELFHVFLGLHVEYILLYEKYKCFVIVSLFVVAGFEVKEELIQIDEDELQQ